MYSTIHYIALPIVCACLLVLTVQRSAISPKVRKRSGWWRQTDSRHPKRVWLWLWFKTSANWNSFTQEANKLKQSRVKAIIKDRRESRNSKSNSKHVKAKQKKKKKKHPTKHLFPILYCTQVFRCVASTIAPPPPRTTYSSAHRGLRRRRVMGECGGAWHLVVSFFISGICGPGAAQRTVDPVWVRLYSVVGKSAKYWQRATSRCRQRTGE